MQRNNAPRDGAPYITQIPARPGQTAVDQDVDLRPTRDVGQGSHVQREDPQHVDGRADASYLGYGVYATLDGSRVDSSEFADPEWAGRKLEPDRLPDTDHTGRGPRTYRRPDLRVHDDICLLLTEDSHLDATEVEVSVEHGEVLLTGTVASRRLKHLAEDIAYRVSGVLDVTNHLKVGPLSGSSTSRGDMLAAEPEDDAPADDPGTTLLPSSLRGRREDAELRDIGDSEAQAERARDRRNLRDYDYQGPRDTSHGERLGKF
jgi:hypothetical protein